MTIKKSILTLIVFFSFCQSAIADINDIEKTRTHKYTLSKNVDFKLLLGELHPSSEGIIANTFGSGGKISVSVYVRDESTADKERKILYKVYLDHASSTPALKSYIQEFEYLDIVGGSDGDERYFNNVHIDTKELLQLAQRVGVPSQISEWNAEDYCSSMIKRGLSIAKYYFLSTLDVFAFAGSGQRPDSHFKCESRTVFNQVPVSVEVEVTDANFISVDIPGIGLITADMLKADDLVVNIYAGDTLIRHLSATYSNASELDIGTLPIGEELRFEVSSTTFSNVEEATLAGPPTISGMPDLQIIRFAGEAFYYVTPSVVPGGFTPFVGFDSQVHGTVLRAYPDYDFSPRIENWELRSSDLTYHWSFPLKLMMDPDVSNYVAPHIWCKEKYTRKADQYTTPCEVPGLGPTQRNNQREGLNMELLHAWHNWQGDYAYEGHYSGDTYIAGLDPDELVTFNDSLGEQVALFKLPEGHEPWKVVPDGEGTSALNDVITAYQKHREKIDNDRHYGVPYTGYELQDVGTSPQHPNGTGAYTYLPGTITLSQGDKAINFKVKTRSLTGDNGFYGSLTGPQWPSVGEKNVPYTLHGIDHKLMGNYVMELAYEDHLGKTQRQTRYLNNDEEGLLEVRAHGTWTEAFDIKGWGYYTLTAYYQKDNGPRIPIAGKELLEVSVRFLGEQAILHEGRGDGAYIYLDNYYDTERSDTVQKYNRYVDKYVRDYVFNLNATTRFETMDSDPHTFHVSGTEWYLSERTRAKQIPDSELHQELQYYVYPITNGQASTQPVVQQSGKTFSHTWDTEGEYELKITYRNTSEMYYRVKIVNYPHSEMGLFAQKASIAIRNLTQQEKNWLSLSSNNYKLVEVVDVLSKFSYVDGLRADPVETTSPDGIKNNQENRFEAAKNYSGRYKWLLNGGELSRPSAVTSFLADYQNTWYPKDWIRHFSEAPLPSDVDASVIIDSLDNLALSAHLEDAFSAAPREPDSLYSAVPVINEPWQIRYPWISMTDTEGPRSRTNVKVIYNMPQLFDIDHGAFSGMATQPTREVLLRLMTDEEKDKKQFQANLKTNLMFLIPADTIGVLSVDNVTNYDQRAIPVAHRTLH